MKEALLYSPSEEGKVRCHLCNHRCLILPSRRGLCGVRENRGGTLYSLVYGRAVALNPDPVEKKPLFHFLPSTISFSIAAAGCNFRCLQCQNHEISQLPITTGGIEGRAVSPEEIVSLALQAGALSISYTYTEPTIYFEYALETARLARGAGLRNVFVTNGYMTEEALRMIQPWLDAANVDLKSYEEAFYKRVCGARVKPVLDNLRLMRDLGIWVEVTTLVIPTLNDSDRELEAIARYLSSLGPEVPWHVSAFFPTYKMIDLPRTSAASLHRARRLGMEAGLRYVYCGNVPGDDGESTFCQGCGRRLIERAGFRVIRNDLVGGACGQCGVPIEGVWE
jgi:pyruvate formate lyase activating enzyme